MSEPETPTIDYKAEYERMKSDLEKASAESSRRKRVNADLKSEIEALKALTPEKLKTQVETLTGELRTIKHKQGFAALYEDKELGLNPKVNVDRLFSILGYKADSDEFDSAKVKEMVSGLKQTDPYLFVEKQSEESAVTTSQSPNQVVPAWGGRGATSQPTNIVLTDVHYRDPVFMYELAQSQSQAK